MKEPWQLELERTVHFLNTATDTQSRKLWAVLTALRGPDSENFDEKDSITAVILHAIGLRARAYVAGAVVSADSAEYATIAAGAGNSLNITFPTMWCGMIRTLLPSK